MKDMLCVAGYGRMEYWGKDWDRIFILENVLEMDRRVRSSGQDNKGLF